MRLISIDSSHFKLLQFLDSLDRGRGLCWVLIIATDSVLLTGLPPQGRRQNISERICQLSKDGTGRNGKPFRVSDGKAAEGTSVHLQTPASRGGVGGSRGVNGNLKCKRSVSPQRDDSLSQQTASRKIDAYYDEINFNGQGFQIFSRQSHRRLGRPMTPCSAAYFRRAVLFPSHSSFSHSSSVNVAFTAAKRFGA